MGVVYEGFDDEALLHRSYRPGGDLLSRALRRSTIGPGRLNDRVRNGIGWGPPGIATRSIRGMQSTRPSRLAAIWGRVMKTHSHL